MDRLSTTPVCLMSSGASREMFVTLLFSFLVEDGVQEIKILNFYICNSQQRDEVRMHETPYGIQIKSFVYLNIIPKYVTNSINVVRMIP